MQTSRFSIQPDYQYTDDGRRRLAGYRVVHALTVTYRDLDTVGTAIDAVSEAGGDEIAFHDIAFAHSDPERHVEAARRDAVDKLHRTARQLAEAASRELGPLLEISEGVAPPNDPYPRPAMSAGHHRYRVAESLDSAGAGRHPSDHCGIEAQEEHLDAIIGPWCVCGTVRGVFSRCAQGTSWQSFRCAVRGANRRGRVARRNERRG